MCGILGCVYKTKSVNARDDFVQSLQILEHRGPDFRDFTQSDNVFLGHTRLAILDLDERSNQPMVYKNKYILVFNGEIYNYKELKEELYKQGYRFHTQGDAEVLLCAYDFWGEACVEHFNGMWAFALLDKSKSKIFCSRDRFGEKPFFYYQDENQFIFASEIKAILPYLKERKANIPAMIPFIIRQNVDCYRNETFFKEIYRLNPSENLVINLNDFSFCKSTYYAINTKEITTNNPSLKIREILEDSVKLRLRSDVKVGGCLSGGLDSSCLNALIVRYVNPKDFIAIHAKSTLKESDESDFAQIVAKHLGIELCVIEPSKKDFLNSLEEVIRVQDEPFGSTSIYMQYFVMQKARELGIKVMFDGQGSDEIFLGYEHYFQYIYKVFKDANQEEKFFRDLKSFRYSKEMIIESLKRVENIKDAFNRAKLGGVKEKYLDFEQFKEIYHYTSFFTFNAREINNNNNMQALLRYEDRDSMAFGVESRLPYLDYRLVDYVLALPIFEKFQNGYLKFLLREACEDLLPKNIIWRYNKLGFESPQKLWLEEIKGQMLECIENSKILKEIFTKITIKEDGYLWRLYNIAKWEEIYKVVL